MYEVILTYRPDFREKVLERYTTEAEAIAVAEHISMHHRQEVIRVWIRHTGPVKSNP